jgi:hypothetical protein
MLEFKTIRQLKADKEFLDFIGKRPPDSLNKKQ